MKKMRNLITTFFVVTAVYFLTMCQIERIYATPSNGNTENHRNRASRGIPRYHSRSATQYGRMKPDTMFNDFGDDDDIFDLSKRQQPPSDDYGHLRFGKRDEMKFDDYGHMRFGRNGGDTK